jgi:hypothetical protein
MSIATPATPARSPRARPNRGPFASEEEALHEVVDRLAQSLDPKEIWLFGSRAAGRNAPDSDFDLLVVAKIEDGDAGFDYGATYAPIAGLGIGCDVVPCRADDFGRSGAIQPAFAGTSFRPEGSSMSAERRVAAYFALADRGPRSGNILFRNEQFEDTALFLQQVVERVARALLTHAGVPFGTSHNIGQMADALPPEHPLRDRIRAFDDLSTAVTAYRYPTSSGRLQAAPDASQLRARLDDVALLLREAKAHVGHAERLRRN